MPLSSVLQLTYAESFLHLLWYPVVEVRAELSEAAGHLRGRIRNTNKDLELVSFPIRPQIHRAVAIGSDEVWLCLLEHCPHAGTLTDERNYLALT